MIELAGVMWEFTELCHEDSRGMGYIAVNGVDILHTGAMEFSTADNLAIARLAEAAPETAADRDRLEVAVTELYKALAFAQSVIKSGEPWTPDCAKIIGGALDANRHTKNPSFCIIDEAGRVSEEVHELMQKDKT